jgi:hypothetical protein
VKKTFKLIKKREPFQAMKQKLRSMAVDNFKAVLYCTGEHLLLGMELDSNKPYSEIKMSNSWPSDIAIDEQQRRLYCATREGLLLFFDISQRPNPVLVHTMKLVKNPDLGGPFAKQIDFDQERNILFCRMSTGILYPV